MGLAGVLIKRVFSKSRSSVGLRDGNEKNFGADRGRWSLTRLKFCGDDFDSVLAEEDDLASCKSSEETVIQSVAEASEETVTLQSTTASESEEIDQQSNAKESEEQIPKEQNSPIKMLGEEDAVIIIQSAFRGFQARCQCKQIRQLGKDDGIVGIDNLSRVSMGTSIEVQAGDSPVRAQEENTFFQHNVLRKTRSQVLRLKEDWDDSTVSSNISKLRIQNRLEATTRRERALAYAFSQQLRTCSTKKKTTLSEPNEPNMGWNWLERWMATRQPETSSVEDCLGRHFEFEPISGDRRSMVFKKQLDVSVEEKESCGSNDVSVSIESHTIPSQTAKNEYRPVKNRLKATKNMSRRKKVASYHYTSQSKKVTKRDSKEAEKERKQKQLQSKNVGEIELKDASHAPSDH